MSQRYEAIFIDTVGDPNYRITDTKSDSRVATCYLKENAELVTAALNTSASSGDAAAVLRLVLEDWQQSRGVVRLSTITRAREVLEGQR